MLRVYVTTSLLFLAGCTYFIKPPTVEDVTPSEEVSYEFSEDGRIVTIHIPHGAVAPGETVEELLHSTAGRIDYETYFPRVEDDSLKRVLSRELRDIVGEGNLFRYSYREISSDQRAVTIILDEDQSGIARLASELMKKYENVKRVVHDFSYLSQLSLLLPCPNVPVPEDANLLPNAPRDYRSGTHRGIDFPAPYGSQVRSVADGIVTRADHDYREITNEFRDSLLKKASFIGYTPSDVFEHILLGRSVFIDHGVDMVPGKRLVSIHAHLSQIDESIQVGKSVRRGQLVGLCGNSGTSDGAEGTRQGAHLHYELIIQDENGEWYMGQGLPHPELIDLLNAIFNGQ
ncbi:MAG: M23 family metallopeptidase [Candidatus Neomarinimicrobiota bacterium]